MNARAVLLACLLMLAPGCATTFSGLCGVKPVGKSEAGLLIALVHCEAARAAH